MFERVWKAFARVVSTRVVSDWLIRQAQHTPYTHITSPDGSTVYMYRWWLFNPYDEQTRKTRYTWCPISIRVHRIMTPDHDRHLHDHPWNARTIILRGHYWEDTEDGRRVARRPGDTRTLKFGEYHRIARVALMGGATTLFITGKYRGTWGFLVDGVKVPWREYLK